MENIRKDMKEYSALDPVQHVADVLQWTIASSPRHTEFQMHTPYFPRLRVLKDRYMRSSCKGVNSVILRSCQHVCEPQKSRLPSMTKQYRRKEERKKKEVGHKTYQSWLA